MPHMIGSRTYQGPDIIDFSEVTKGFYAELAHLTCITLEGEKALNVLQGQLTNHLLNLKQNSLQNNLICNLKGQLITKLRVLNVEGQIRMICPQDLIAEVIHILEKPAALARVKMQKIDEKIYGIVQPSPVATSLFQLAQHAYLCFYPPQDLEKKSSLEWHFQRLLDLDFEIYPETCRMFHPHDLELEKNDWIHFNKGCYRGQEIIARMHYRGKRKYQLVQVNMDASALYPGLEINSGIVVDFCPINPQQNLVLLRSKIR